MKKEILNRIIKQKEPSVSELIDENRSLRRKNRSAYAGLIVITAFGALASYYVLKTSSTLKKEHERNVQLSENVSYLKKDAANLFFQNMDLKDYANKAQTLADSMTFYPDMPDFTDSLPEKDQEKAQIEVENQNIQKATEHKNALEKLGIDMNLLYQVQNGPRFDR